MEPVEPLEPAYQAYEARRIAAAKKTIFGSGCTSWYLDSQGKNRTIWPKFTFQYWWETRRVVPEHFAWRTAKQKAPAAA